MKKIILLIIAITLIGCSNNDGKSKDQITITQTTPDKTENISEIPNNILSEIKVDYLNQIGFESKKDKEIIINDGIILAEKNYRNYQLDGMYNGDYSEVSITNNGNIKGQFSNAIFIANKSIATNNGNIDIGRDNLYSRGMGAIYDSSAINNGNINLKNNSSIGMDASNDSYLENNHIININGTRGYAMRVEKNSTAINNGVININGDSSYGMKANENSIIINNRNGIINLNGQKNIGMSIKNNSVIENYGTINLNGTKITENLDSNNNKVFDNDSSSTIINKGEITFKGGK